MEPQPTPTTQDVFGPTLSNLSVLAENAKRQADTAQDMEHRQLRAYVSLTPGTLADFVVGKSPKLNYTVTNGGETPAFKLDFTSATDFEVRSPSGTYERPLAPPSHQPYEIGIASKEAKPANVATPTLTQSVYDSVIGNKIAFVYFGDAKFIDVFGIQHPVQFCFFYDAAAIARGTGTFCANHNDYNG